ncbi:MULTISPECIES: recombinase family protein, partial [unclassified Sphingomonas]
MRKSPPRIAIYGRHSTDKQSESSSRDQAAACSKLVDFLGGTVVNIYLDPEMSGYDRTRPGLQRLLADCRAGHIDIVVSESLDRLARDGEDVHWLGKRLRFDRVELHTMSENHIDEVKLAVAGLLGSLFLKSLVEKTHRGLQAVVLSGRFAGGSVYGYRKVNLLDANGHLIPGLREIDEDKAEIVRRIFRGFAAGKSSIQIATELNQAGIPGPRGGLWNASTIRGDPKKHVGILNNPLYRGLMIWNRREWRRNPDSDGRERLYRLRDQSEWIEVEAPTLRIIEAELWDAVQAELARRARPDGAAGVTARRRQRHLLSGLIKCAACGSSYVISGKDYYRCASQKERGTCSNTVPVRKNVIEGATLSALRNDLLTENHARLFAEEFRREAKRLVGETTRSDDGLRERLKVVVGELVNLERNMLSGVLSPRLTRLLNEREVEKSEIESRLATMRVAHPTVALPSIPVLLKQFEEKIGALYEALDGQASRTEAAGIVARLIDRVTIHPDGAEGPEAEVEASANVLARFAINGNSRRPFEGGGCCSMT